MIKTIASAFQLIKGRLFEKVSKPKRRQRKSVSLTAMDELIFGDRRPNLEYLQTSYGQKVHMMRYEHPQYDQYTKFSGEEEQYQQQEEQFQRTKILIPLVLFAGYYLKRDEVQCFFGGSSSLKKNVLEQRVVSLQYAANNPIEDRFKVTSLSSGGYVVSVFDGHGGWQLAEYATNILHDKIDRFITANKLIYSDQDDCVRKSIEQAYQEVEKEFYEVAIKAYQMGFPSVARVGTCALTAVVVNDKLYSANLGDCKGIIVNVDDKGVRTYTKINHMHNANSKKEQTRLKSAFTDDDIVICKKGPTSCYVKGRLQPTRTLGDFRLKFPEFNNPQNQSTDKGFVKPIENFQGPYISAIPDQQVFQLKKGDKFLVMGSDGLWDEMTKQEISKIVCLNKDNKDRIIKEIFEQSIAHAARGANLSDQEIRAIPLGKRRKIHDDITILVVDLDKQL